MGNQRILQIVSLPATIFGATALTWKNFFDIPLYPQLAGTAILGFIAILLAANYLGASNEQADPPIAGFDLRRLDGAAEEANASRFRKWLPQGVLAAFSAIIVVLLFLQVDGFGPFYQIAEEDSRATLTLKSKRHLPEPIFVNNLPGPPVDCKASKTGATLEFGSWEDPTRRLTVIQRQLPMEVKVECNVSKPFDGWYLPSGENPQLISATHRLILFLMAIILGILLWIVGFFRYRSLRC